MAFAVIKMATSKLEDLPRRMDIIESKIDSLLQNRELKQSQKLHISFDVDGTLEGYCDGPVSPKLCRRLKEKGATLWMLSGRDTVEETQAILAKFHMKQATMITGKDYIDIKTKSLLNLKTHNPSETIVYVGDRIDDMLVAIKAGIIYCNPTVLTEDIFEEVRNPTLKAIL